MKTIKQNNLLLIFVLFFIFEGKVVAQNSLQFNSIDSLFAFAEKNSATIKGAEQQNLLAKWTKIASIGNTINIKSPFTASWIDNTLLPVNYLPAEAFGGPVGTFKQVSLGQQFVTSYGITPQIDIINPAAWARIKSAEMNKQLTETNNLIAKKNLFESISASYYNIISLQNQIVYVQKNLAAADSILLIAKNKFNEGIIREQDVNNASVNSLSLYDKLNQLKFSLEQNYNSLKILCDISSDSNFQISEKLEGENNSTTLKAEPSSLIEKQWSAQSAYLKSELAANRLTSFSPTLSLVFNHTWQQNSNVSFTDANANKFNAQYIGVKLTVPFPLDVNRMSTNYTSKINYTISNINYTHSKLQNQINNKQLDLDYQKANSTYSTTSKIKELKEMNYSKSLNQYSLGIISTDVLLTAFNEKINAQLNYSNAIAGLKYSESKININNTIK